ncbi:hypothetical protein CUC08_Gglean007727 [Alternaria sp. MG1]|nr:hypothetical protein CUC08_Gglean007727 [Alternaria sp. MG1]
MMDLSSKSIAQQQRQIIIRDTLDRCSTHDYETTWRQIRKSGNTNLYTQMPEYVQWATRSDPETLILVGKLGYGKSVTLANMVDDLNLRIDPASSGLAYFFCRHDLPESLVARTVIGALTRQIINLFPQRVAEVEVMDTDDFRPFLGLMGQVVPPKHAIYIILDGLDLCSRSERDTILEHLSLMGTQFDVHTCVSLRLDPEVELHAISTEFPKAKAVRFPNNTSDIDAFVRTQLEIALSNQSLALGDPSIILEIQDALLQGSQHMFLWVALQIQSLCMMQTDHDIRQALADLPRDLSQIYSRILQQATRLSRPSQSDVFKLILTSRRPLTAQEMREALSVVPGDTMWDPAKLLNSIYPSLATCGCLITVDEEELTIRTIHPSVNQFLLRNDSTPPDNLQQDKFSLRDAQALMSSIIVTYLSYGIFGTEIAIRSPPLNVGSVPSQIIRSTTHTGKSVQSIALKLLRSSKRTEFDASKTLAEKSKEQIPSNLGDFQFQHYAKKYALLHLTELPVISCAIPEGLVTMFKHGIIRIRKYDEVIGLLWLMLQYPVTLDVVDLIRNQYTKDTLEGAQSSLDNIFPRMFYRAIEIGSINAVEHLLDTYRGLDCHSPPENPFTSTFIFCTLYLGWRPMLNSYTDFFGPAPLSYAIIQSQDLVFEVLLNDGLITQHKITDTTEHYASLDLWDKPIGVAMKLKRIRVLKLLLSSQHSTLRLTLSDHEIELLSECAQKLPDSSVADSLEIFKRRREESLYNFHDTSSYYPNGPKSFYPKSKFSSFYPKSNFSSFYPGQGDNPPTVPDMRDNTFTMFPSGNAPPAPKDEKSLAVHEL